uniref:Multiple myeloma tumor-associated protein 2-like N-terminal domain-containing protein n=1 Tax=Alexandrium andersonii TaxID=327968 RepID=A0A7S2HSU1_9DINO
MGDPLKVRIRDGCRGGSEQFKWNSIKEQEFKDRECYLGASTKVGMMGKFARYYVHDWYAKKRETTETIDSERNAVQAYEEELMQEALGLKPKKLLLSKRQLTEDEMKDLLRREDDKGSDQKGRDAMGPQKKVMRNEHGEEVATSNEEMVAIAARDALVKGIGFASHRTSKLEEIKAKTLGTVSSLEGTSKQGPVSAEEIKLEEIKNELQGGSSSSSSALRPKEEAAEVKQEVKEEVNTEEGGLRSAKRPHAEEGSEERKRRKAAKKEVKKEKKRKKAEKKLRKAEKKLKKQEKKQRKAAKKEAAQQGKRTGRNSPTPERPAGGWRSSSGSGSSSSSS